MSPFAVSWHMGPSSLVIQELEEKEVNQIGRE